MTWKLMDAIEVGRQTAERLHIAMVATGQNPCTPYAFALAEASKRSLEVEKVQKGDVRLHGARALYDPDALLVLHEDVDDDFTHAFLVAHEIGHVEFGGQTDLSEAVNVDPMRAAEASPVGIDRVIDYSRRERREVQMDLFAREFLLPRSVVRNLHINDGLTASEIATRFGAPFAIVVLQLLDALLLPIVDLKSPGKHIDFPLNSAQAKAVAHRGTPYLLEAGPGTGKTQTLVARVDDLLNTGVDAERILVLTFSNKAAGELFERIAMKRPEAAAAMWIGTFHAFGLDVVRRFHDRLELPPDPRLLDRSEAIEFLEDEFPRLGLHHFKNIWDPSFNISDILSAISRANDEVVDAVGYRALANEMHSKASTDEEQLAAERSLEVAAVFDAYEQLKGRMDCVDFGDLVSMPVRLCENDPVVREHLAGLYDHVLVDEFQDVNRSSVRLLKALTDNGKNLWVVGDAKQSIYRFRGASSFNVARFGTDEFSGGKRERLKINYRSVEEIKQAFVKFATYGMRVVAGSDVGLQSNRGSSGNKPEYRSVEMANDEIAAVAEAIEEMREAGHSYRNQALLCSGNDRLGKFAAGLERLGIPVLYLGSLFEREEIKDLLSLLSTVVDRRAMGLLRVATMTDYALSLADAGAILAHLKENSPEPLAWTKGAGVIPNNSDDGIDGLKRIAGLLEGIAPTAKPWHVLATVLLDRSRLAANIANASDIRSRSQGVAIWQFMNFLRSQPQPSGQGLPITRLLKRIRRLVLLSDERDLRQLPTAALGIDAVRLMTIHGSKGLEFPVVHIPGMNAGTMPQSPNMARGIAPPDGLVEGATGSGADAVKAAHLEEQECLFFVALSRAKDRLLLYSPTKKANKHKRSRSPYIDLLGTALEVSHVTPKRGLPVSRESLPVNVTFDGDIVISDKQLGLFQRCPRRFLYTHILTLGGRRTETAFMKLHVAVQQVINSLVDDHAVKPTDEEVDASLVTAWDAHGLGNHGYSEEYRHIAKRLIAYYLKSTEGLTTLPSPELRHSIGSDAITICPDQVLSDASGRVTMRRIKTGHKTSKEGNTMVDAAFLMAAGNHTSECSVELVHLGDEAITPIVMTPRVLENRKASLSQVAEKMRSGHFPMEQGRSCPSCPAFFICGPLPEGPISKKY